MIVSNLELDSDLLRYKYKKPFDMMAFCNETSNWLPLPVANSFTGVVRYKWDTKSIELKVSHMAKQEDDSMAKVEQKPHEFTEEERQRLVDFMDILIQIDQKEKARFARLKDEPNGFAMAGEGRDCGLCGMSVWDKADGWLSLIHI